MSMTPEQIEQKEQALINLIKKKKDSVERYKGFIKEYTVMIKGNLDEIDILEAELERKPQ